MKEKLNATNVYILSIISFLCCCFAGLGVLFAAPAFFIATSKLKDAKQNPENYDQDSVKAMNTAKTVALIALVLNAVYLLRVVYVFATSDWNALIEQQREIMEQYGV